MGRPLRILENCMSKKRIAKQIWIRHAGVIGLLFLIGHLLFDWCVIRWGWKNKHCNDICLKGIGLCLQIWLATWHSIENTIGRTYLFIWRINKHPLPTIIMKSREVQISIWFLSMLHHRFANATHATFCKSNQENSENMKNVQNNTHIPYVKRKIVQRYPSQDRPDLCYRLAVLMCSM